MRIITLLLLPLVISPVGLSASQIEPIHYHEMLIKRHHVYLRQRLNPLFIVHGELWVGRSEEFAAILPIDTFDRLYFISRSKFIRTERLNDLANHVRIATPAQALNFVKLRTSKDTFALFPDNQKIEIDINRPVAESGSHFAKLPLTSVTWKHGRFLISRALFSASYKPVKPIVVYIKESVSSTGQYQVLNRTPLGSVEKFGVRQMVPVEF